MLLNWTWARACARRPVNDTAKQVFEAFAPCPWQVEIDAPPQCDPDLMWTLVRILFPQYSACFVRGFPFCPEAVRGWRRKALEEHKLPEFLRSKDVLLSQNFAFFEVSLAALPVHPSGCKDSCRCPVCDHVRFYGG